ncbi:Putative Mn2+ efflux pump MntP [Parelusimicrobium proximum]|uniref:manganese efflux pump MntP n=1 Tax=Parelusimicrobium proximum TaxID=3228953 RepID=UPI003D17A787
MELIPVIIMFVCLCVDNMVVSNMSAMKTSNSESRNSLSVKIAMMFAVCHLLFLMLGYFLGFLFPADNALAAVWVSFAFIFLIGARLLLESIEKSPSFSITDSDINLKMVKVSILIAANSGMIGFALKIMGRGLVWPLFILFFISLIMSMVGFAIGKPDAKEIGSKKLQALAGIIMIILALRIVIMAQN